MILPAELDQLCAIHHFHVSLRSELTFGYRKMIEDDHSNGDCCTYQQLAVAEVVTSLGFLQSREEATN